MLAAHEIDPFAMDLAKMGPAAVINLTPLKRPSLPALVVSFSSNLGSIFLLGFKMGRESCVNPASPKRPAAPSRETLSPTALSLLGLMSSTYVWSALLPQRTIPSDIIPASLRDFMFAKTMILSLSISSRVT